MQVKTLICDWFAPHELLDPIVLVVRHQEGQPIDLVECPAIREAFIRSFGNDLDLGPEVDTSEWIYDIIAFDGDVSVDLVSWATVLKVDLIDT
jgi:hypothetical protein